MRANENRLQLRKNADYRWNDADGYDIYDKVDGWSVNKYICQCKLLTASFDVNICGAAPLAHGPGPQTGVVQAQLLGDMHRAHVLFMFESFV